jgi:predicted DNA-binding transcriptional regulator YafY
MAAYYNSDAPARAARLFKIVTLIASRRSGERIGREQLAGACDCTVKTIQRDLLCLQEATVPIEYDPLARSYVLAERGWKYPLVQMTATDAMALAMARGLLLNTPVALPFTMEIAAALEKATAGLTPAMRTLMEAAAQAFSDRGGTARDYSRAPLGLLLEAISRRQTVTMDYESRSSGVREARTVDPYRLDRRDGRYFELHAWCHRRQQVRTFALDRIGDVTPTGEAFTPRPWDANDEGVIGGLRGGPLVAVEVQFDTRVATYARERRWGFRTTFEEAPGGSVVMRGVVRGTEGILKELLTWQRHARVLGGPELRARMTEEVTAMAALYPPGSGSG